MKKTILQLTIILSFIKPLLSNNLANQFAFEENKGQIIGIDNQTVNSVLYRLQQSGVDVYITNKGLTYIIKKTEYSSHNSLINNKLLNNALDTVKVEYSRIEVELKDASILINKAYPEQAVNSFKNYYLSDNQFIENIPSYQKIVIKDVYPQIDWVLLINNQGLKYDFILHPGADLNKIKLVYLGAKDARLIDDNNFIATSSLGNVKEGELKCYQGNYKNEIASSFSYQHNELSFKINNYDHNKDLIIDPPLVWSTFYGGNGEDYGKAITTDAQKNVYAVGYTFSTNFPTQDPGSPNYFDGVLNGTWDAYIVKFNSTNARIWATYFGGTGNEVAQGVAANSNNEIYITGETQSANFPTLQNGALYFDNSLSGGGDAFITKLDGNGQLLWSSLLGGNASDAAYSVALDKNNNLFITGMSASTDIPLATPSGAYTQPSTTIIDAFIAKFDAASLGLTWFTYYGGAVHNDIGYGITTDNTGNVWVYGMTQSTDFPTYDPGLPAYFDGSLAAGQDNFILKFTNTGQRLWATYYGGSGNEFAGGSNCITTDVSGNMIATGFTNSSTDFNVLNPGTPAFFQSTNGGGAIGDAYLIKFTNSCQLTWATFLGGLNTEFGQGVATDINGDIYATGLTSSKNFPVVDPMDGSYYLGTNPVPYNHIYLTRFNSANKMLWSTYYGGASECSAWGLSVDASKNIYLIGDTYANGPNAFPTLNEAGAYNQDSSGNGYRDAVILRFSPSLQVTATSTDNLCSYSKDGTATATANGSTPYTYSWSPTGGTNSMATGLSSGIYTVTVTDASSNTATSTVSVSAPTAITATITTIDASCGNSNGSASTTTSGGTSGYTYSWTGTGNTTNTLTGLSANTYTLITTDSKGCKDTSTTTVNNTGGPSLLLNSTNPVKCFGGTDGNISITASGGTSGYTYTWTNNSGSLTQNTSSVTGLISGIYTVTVHDINNCSSTKTFSISEPEAISIQVNGTTNASCNAANGSAAIAASGGTTGYTYSWSSNNQSTATITGLAAGNYTIQVTDANNCTSTTSINITSINNLNVIISNDTTIVQNGTAALSASGGTTYTWSPGNTLSCTSCSNPVASPTITTTYTVNISDGNGCTGIDSVTIYVELPCGNIFIPTAFSPNGDGVNDVFKIRSNCIKNYSLVIYSRWGEKLFETNDITIGWDGTYQGKIENTGTFTFMIKATFQNGEKIDKKGNVVLVR